MSDSPRMGKVILAGAGPGDADLITIKLQRVLGESDVILTDRLVNPEIISRHAKKEAEVILVGKQGFNDASATRERINELLIRYAKEGKTVLRLKGGDVAFFSNVLDELVTCKENNIPFEIIPGITAASGASAYTGIPLTARNYAQGVQWLAYNPKSNFTESRFNELANTSDTLVFYMAAKNLIDLAKELLMRNKNSDKGIAVIEQATTKFQQVHITSLKNCAEDFARIEFSSPSIVFIGNIVELYHQFNWFTPKETGTVFPELED